MSEPTIEASCESVDFLSLETHPDQVLIDQAIENDKSVVKSIKRGVAKVVEKILS